MTFTINLSTFTTILKGGLYKLTKDCKDIVKNKLYNFIKTLKHGEKLVFTMSLHYSYATCKGIFSCIDVKELLRHELTCTPLFLTQDGYLRKPDKSE